MGQRLSRGPLARIRIEQIADGGSFQEIHGFFASCNPLQFEGYEKKLNQARLRSGEKEAVVTGFARIGGYPCMLGVMEPEFMMGTLGVVGGEKLARLFQSATRRRLPVVTLAASGGARMQEGALALYQMAKTVSAVRAHAKRGLFYLSVVCDPTLGGVSASFASLGDVILVLEGARFGFTGRRIVEETTHETLPSDFQTASYAREHGQVDRVIGEEALRPEIIRQLGLHTKQRRGK